MLLVIVLHWHNYRINADPEYFHGKFFENNFIEIVVQIFCKMGLVPEQCYIKPPSKKDSEKNSENEFCMIA